MDDSEFVVVDDVPIWKEHVNRRDYDEPVRFEKQDLERIIERCNERIADTNDYVPIVIGHTKEDGSNDPKVVGFAGPFKLGRIGKKNPKWAILARKRFFKQDAEEVRRYPRCSVEYWSSKKDPKGGYFDPISLLGAETPELDLGLRYKKKRGMVVARYSMTAPSGSNTFIPGTGDDEKHEYTKGAPTMLTQDDIAQLCEAIKPIVEAVVEEKLAAGKAEPMPDALGDAAPLDAVPGDEPAADDLAAQPPLDAPTDDIPADEPPSDSLPIDADKQDDDMADMPKPEKKDDEEKAKYQKEVGETKAQYAKVKAELDEVKVNYAKVVAERDTLKAAEEVAYRYQKLTAVEKEGFVIPGGIEKELDHCKELGFSRDQFDKHCERVKLSYQKVHTGGLNLPLEKPAVTLPKTDGADMEKRVKYAKMAEDAVTEARKAGKSLDYGDELNRLWTEDKQAA